LRMMTPKFLTRDGAGRTENYAKQNGRLTPSFTDKVRIMARFQQPQNLINLLISWAKWPFQRWFPKRVTKMTQKTLGNRRLMTSPGGCGPAIHRLRSHSRKSNPSNRPVSPLTVSLPDLGRDHQLARHVARWPGSP
jgi:hypothetical protein